MRIYIPLLPAELGHGSISPRMAHAVTDDLRRALPAEDQEGHEYVAFLAAADDSLRLLTDAQEHPARRVVAAAEVGAGAIELPAIGEDVLPTAIYLVDAVDWDRVESIHVDEPDAEADLLKAIAGDDAAFERSVEHDLLWHDVTERVHLAAELGSATS